ncbi:amidohydrolase family protein [Lentzea flava]|uniref:N-ethylammeline chlorohydrolase n=1 Tax=Lentzea flava TaxID=103732 RepID=A0ABQ2UIL7_9PSEU|nr:amidohydrolase family protein [Lentzea flava]MCP2199029.1 Cytosine/adenosine deaminase [Lentzea flava]GGU32162.1 N-ethylammeline chlorohydrolase [Lentzea flava]
MEKRLFALTLALVLGSVFLVHLGASDETGKTLIRNASMVLTMDTALGTLEDADVLIDGDRIAAVGRGVTATGAKVIDGRGKIVMPGFVDLHTHLWQSLIRGCATDEELGGWLGSCVLPLQGSPVDGTDAYAGARLSTLDTISTGVTTVTDWSHAFNPDFARGNLRALTDSGQRFVFAYLATADSWVAPEVRRVKRDVIDRNPLAHLMIGTHPASWNVANVEASQKLADELGVPLNVHLLESKADPATDQMGVLRRAGALRPGLLANHVVHATDAELDELAAHDVRIAHNPLSNMRLASGVARVPDMKARNLKVGIGLDGGTNDTSDMFNDMRAALGLQRAQSTDAARYPTPADVLRMATLGGAEALGLENEIGSLTPGKKADLQVIDTQALNFAPKVDWPSQLVFTTQPVNVQWVFVNGVALKKNGKVAGDTGRVIADAQAAADRVRKYLGR